MANKKFKMDIYESWCYLTKWKKKEAKYEKNENENISKFQWKPSAAAVSCINAIACHARMMMMGVPPFFISYCSKQFYMNVI